MSKITPNVKFPLKKSVPGFGTNFPPKPSSSTATRQFSEKNATEECTDFYTEQGEEGNQVSTDTSASTMSSYDYKLLQEPGYPFYKLNACEKLPRYMYMENFKLSDFYELNKANLIQQMRKKLPNSTSLMHELCYNLIEDVRLHAHKCKYTNGQGWALMDMFFHLFTYLALNFTQCRSEFYEFFRETLLLYSYDNPPFALLTFTPMECFSIAKLFEDMFHQNFNILRTVVFMPNIQIVMKLH